jgi:hypothetical protein
MLEEVGGAVGLFGLGAGAGIDPHADRRGLGVGRVLGRDLEIAMRVSSEPVTANWRRGKLGELTVRPFLSVVVSVLMAGEWCGVASPRLGTVSPPARPRRPCARFRASLRDAMGEVVRGVWENEWFEGKVWLLACFKKLTPKHSVILPHLQGKARERPGQTWLPKLLSRGAAACRPASLLGVLQFGYFDWPVRFAARFS